MKRKSKVTAVIGSQWGDEGKGKVIDFLAQRADVVVRFNGGNNAGHTVVTPEGEFALHLIPAGIFNPATLCVIGPGVVVHLPTLWEEMKTLQERGISCKNLRISTKAHLVMPWHIVEDGIAEKERGKQKIGTTLRGIGPCYSDKAWRRGIRAGDLLRPQYFRTKFLAVHREKARIFSRAYDDYSMAEEDSLLRQWQALGELFSPFICDTDPLLWEAIDSGKKVLLEGAQGALLDVDHGSYPFCTSSNCGVSAAAEGSGISPFLINEVIGVVKAYTTRVGAGPFPTRMDEDMDALIREKGREYGATTGRPRMCGWLDLPQLRWAARRNGFTKLAVTKLDVLSNVGELKMGIGYLCRKTGDFCEEEECARADQPPRYRQHKGWSGDISLARRLSELPRRAREYLRQIEQYTGVPIGIISVGAGREETIVV